MHTSYVCKYIVYSMYVCIVYVCIVCMHIIYSSIFIVYALIILYTLLYTQRYGPNQQDHSTTKPR